jgi:epoxyqueuosine reductase QueG
VADGRHGQMGWMEERMHWRGNPAALWPEARTVIMLAEPYTPPGDPLEVLGQPRARRDQCLCRRKGLSRSGQEAPETARSLAD